MATNFGGFDPPDESIKQNIVEGQKQQGVAPKYVDLLNNKPYVRENNRVPSKLVIMMYGEPTVTWKLSEVKSLKIQ